MPLGATLSSTDHHGVGAVALGLAAGLGRCIRRYAAPPAQGAHTSLSPKQTEHVSTEPFGNIPKGPIQIFVSINQQKLHLYSDGVHVADTSVATGVPSLPTPLGVFSVIQKQVFHRSNIYSNAPMPFMQRITWSGVALHEGENIGHQASHGCIRMPRDFAMRLYKLTRIGARVIVARGELKPAEFADAHLFVHKDKRAGADRGGTRAGTNRAKHRCRHSGRCRAGRCYDGGAAGRARLACQRRYGDRR